MAEYEERRKIMGAAVCPFTHPQPAFCRKDCALCIDGKCAFTLIALALSDRRDQQKKENE